MIKNCVYNSLHNVPSYSGETIRDFDGLALSSRNSHLSSSERANANLMYRTLVNIKEEIIKNHE